VPTPEVNAELGGSIVHRIMKADGRLQSVVLYITVVLLATAIGGHLLGLWAEGFGTPISYAGDTVSMSAIIKGIAEHGQPYENPSLGAPSGGQMYDFPGADLAHVALLWLISRFTVEYAVVLNVFSLLTYPLIALAAAWAFRRLGFSRVSALAFSILYATIPFHQSRVTVHQYLSAYWVVPLAVAMIATVVFDARSQLGAPPERRFAGLPVWAWLVVLAMGTCGVYYAFFGVVLTMAAALVAAYTTRDVRRLLPAAAVIVATIALLGLQYLPSYLFWQQAGNNSTAELRQPGEADFYALRMSQLVFPVIGHRYSEFAAAKASLRDSLTTIGLRDIAYDSSLGVVGVVGFFTLLFWLMTSAFRPPPRVDNDTPAKLSVLVAVAFLLATVGGVGGLIAFAGFPQIRGYDRITPYIAFMSFGAVAWFVDAAIQRFSRDAPPTRLLVRFALAVAALSFLVVFGLWDQTTPATKPQYSVIRAEFEADRAFVAAAENLLPEGAMVFQLPYVGFPETGPVVETAGYDPLRLYLHSKTLRWSAGAFKGRGDATWQEDVSGHPVQRMVAEVADTGFAAIVVDRHGYKDRGTMLESELTSALGVTRPAAASPDGRYALYLLEL